MFRVAVVDDEEGVRVLVQTILEERGYAVELHESCASARAALSASPPDLLICDVRLPDGDGLELVAELRAKGRRFPAIVLSGMSREQDFVRGFAAGAVDYLAKPFSPPELLARCQIHLNRRRPDDTKIAPSVYADEDGRVPLRDGLAFGRYRIEATLGKGGAGIVYRARDEQRGGALVALKVLLAGADDEARLRFLRETYALSSVHDARIVAIHDLGSSDGRLYYAMELIEGETLRARIERTSPLGENDALALLRGLAEALAVIEDARILHRDLKPDNVILRGGKLTEPVLVDFGLAKRRFDRAVTAVDFIVGTPGYMPPEVILGGEPDKRSDLFGLGLVVRAAMTGEELFPHLRGNDLLLTIAAGPIPMPDVPLSPAFAAMLAKLVAVKPELRTSSAAELLADIDAIERASCTAAVAG